MSHLGEFVVDLFGCDRVSLLMFATSDFNLKITQKKINQKLP
jgi:hypothetical protein